VFVVRHDDQRCKDIHNRGVADKRLIFPCQETLIPPRRMWRDGGSGYGGSQPCIILLAFSPACTRLYLFHAVCFRSVISRRGRTDTPRVRQESIMPSGFNAILMPGYIIQIQCWGFVAPPQRATHGRMYHTDCRRLSLDAINIIKIIRFRGAKFG
jgi:hypothetical protein